MNIEQLQKENDELKAHIERFREEYEEAQCQWGGDYLWQKWDKDKILLETPAQSLNHIKAQVEEETIQEFASYTVLALEGIASEQAMMEIYDCAKRKPRKYKEQSNGL